jgi:modified peptide precursor CbpA
MKTSPCNSKQSIVATRRSCQPNGTGLSHYVMVDPKK